MNADIPVSELLSHLQKARSYLSEPYISEEEFTRRLQEMEGLFAEILPEGLTFLSTSGADVCGIMLGSHPRSFEHKKCHNVSADPGHAVGWSRSKCYREPIWVNMTDWQEATRQIAEIRRQQVEKNIVDAGWLCKHGYSFGIDWEEAVRQLGENGSHYQEEEPLEELQEPYWKSL